MTLLERLKKNTTVDESDILRDSIIFNKIDLVSTPIPMLNVALSGCLNGGLQSGLTMLAGESKHFKTGFCLVLASAYLKKHKEAAVVFYDSEGGSTKQYFDTFGVDTSRVLHTPITDIEQLKHDVMVQLEDIKRDEKVLFFVDSIGNLASKKEVEDAKEGKSVADMTRAKALKSFGRMVTGHLRIKNIPMILINHTYDEMALYPKKIVSGGQGLYLSSDTVWILGRQQEKEDNKVTGYNFVINVDKSRFVKEKSKILINVGFDYGIDVYSGLLEEALESGHVIKPSMGWYQKKDLDKKVREDDTYTSEFWDSILKDKDFKDFIEKKYTLQ